MSVEALSSQLVLPGIRCVARIGHSDDEAAEPQGISIALVLSFARPPAGVHTDDLADTVDYARIVDTVVAVSASRRFHLLESLAREIRDVVLRALGPGVHLWVEVAKERSPIAILQPSARFGLGTSPGVPQARPMPKLAINIDVDDLETGVAFYTAALGLVPRRRFGESAVELTGAEVPVYLLQKRQSTPPFPDAPGRRDYARHWTPVHLDFLVEKIEDAVLRAVGAGAVAESPIESHPWGRIALLADPFGNGFCLIQLDTAGFEAMTTPYVQPPR